MVQYFMKLINKVHRDSTDFKQKIAVVMSLLFFILFTPLIVNATVPEGIDYLKLQQNSSGGWGAFDEAGFRDTSTVLNTLINYGQTGSSYLAGRANVNSTFASNTDALSRQIISMVSTGDDVTGLVDRLLGAQDIAISSATAPNFPGRGWGTAAGFSSDVLDTALSLRALNDAGITGGVSVVKETISAGGSSASYPFEFPVGATNFFFYVSETTGSIRVNLTQPGGGTVFVDLTAGSAPITIGPLTETVGTWTLFITNTDTVPVTASVDVGYDTVEGFDIFRLSKPLTYLGFAQNPDGGWGVSPGEDSHLMITSEVLQTLHALNSSNSSFGPQTILTNGVAYLLTMQNPDGGFSSLGGASNINETALAMLAIGLINPSAPELVTATTFLQAAQLANGSWLDDNVTTAYALNALASATVLGASIFSGNGGAGAGMNFSTDLDTVVLTGSAPLGTSDLTVSIPGSVVSYNPDTGEYSITVPLAEGVNSIDITTVNGFGQAGGTENILVTRDSSLRAQNVNLIPGLNTVGLNHNPANALTVIGLLDLLGTNAREIQVLDEVTGTYSNVTRDGSGGFIGSNISLAGLEGVNILADGVAFTRLAGSVLSSPTVNLVAGPNHMVFPDPPAGLDAFTVLSTIGDETVVSGIQRFNSTMGSFETAIYTGTNITGINFAIESGISYLVFMRSALAGFVIPSDVTASISITSPVTGTTAYTSPLTVSGTVTGEAPLSVMVNGVVAIVAGETFTVNLPLSTVGSVPITASLVDGGGRIKTDGITITYDPVDYVLPFGSNVSDTRTFSFPPAILSQIAFFSQTNTGVPAGVTYTTTNLSLVSNGTVPVDYNIAVGAGAAPGVHTFQVEYGLLDASSVPLGPLTGNIFTFKILITP